MLKITDQNFATEISNHQGVVLVDFWAPWCGPCRMLSPLLEELSKKFEGQVKFGQLNVDENPGAAAKYSIQGIPSVLIFKNGEPAHNIVGLNPVSTYSDLLDSYLQPATS